MGGKFKGDKLWLTSAVEIARVIGVNPRRIGAMVRDQDLPAWRMGRSWYSRIDDLEKWTRDVADQHLNRNHEDK